MNPNKKRIEKPTVILHFEMKKKPAVMIPLDVAAAEGTPPPPPAPPLPLAPTLEVFVTGACCGGAGCLDFFCDKSAANMLTGFFPNTVTENENQRGGERVVCDVRCIKILFMCSCVCSCAYMCVGCMLG